MSILSPSTLIPVLLLLFITLSSPSPTPSTAALPPPLTKDNNLKNTTSSPLTVSILTYNLGEMLREGWTDKALLSDSSIPTYCISNPLIITSLSSFRFYSGEDNLHPPLVSPLPLPHRSPVPNIRDNPGDRVVKTPSHRRAPFRLRPQ